MVRQHMQKPVAPLSPEMKPQTRHMGWELMAPWSPLKTIQNEVDRIFDTIMVPNWERIGSIWHHDLNPQIDVKETADQFLVSAELPGLDEKDIDITLSDGLLTISGEKKQETSSKGSNYHLNERSYGRFVRTLQLPHGIDESKIVADFSKGVLTIAVKKDKSLQAHQKKITIQTH